MVPQSLGLQGRIGLALGSGAARGWAHIGVIRALERLGVAPDVICGTSIGAVVGAARAAGDLSGFEAWVRGIDWRQVVSYVDLSFRGGLMNPRRLFEFFETALPGCQIDALPIPFAAVGTDLANGQEVWMREGDLREALAATIAIPGLITPSRWRGRWMVDGGLVNPVPVSLCRALGADSVIAVDLNTTLLGRRLVPDLSRPALADAGTAGAGGEALDGDSGLGERVTALVRELREHFSSDDDDVPMPSLYEVMANSVNIMQVRIGRSRMAGDPPELLITPRMSDFAIVDFDRADEAIAEGERAVERAVAP